MHAIIPFSLAPTISSVAYRPGSFGSGMFLQASHGWDPRIVGSE